MLPTVVYPVAGADIKVNPAAIPQCEYDLASRVLYASVKLALADPTLKAEYEAWKKERKEVKK